MAHGGWGYRGSRRKRLSIVVRRGSAIEMRLRGGALITVTTDDAENGAAVLNGLLGAGR